MLCNYMMLLILNLVISLRNISKRSLQGVLDENPRELGNEGALQHVVIMLIR